MTTFRLAIGLLLSVGTLVFATGTLADQSTSEGELKFGIIYLKDADSANGFKALLEKSDLKADLILLDDVLTCDLAPYSGLIVASDIEQAWSNSAAHKIRDAKKPVLGIGEGGCYFFGKLNLAIGSPHEWHGGDVAVRAVHSKKSRFWTSSNIDIPDDKELVLYAKTSHVGIHLPEPLAGVVPHGQELGSRAHYPIVEQDGGYLLWGFTDSPDNMTALGKQLFVHTCRYVAMANDASDSEQELQATAPVSELPAATEKRLQQLEKRVAELEAATIENRSHDLSRSADNPFEGDWAALAVENRGITRISIRDGNEGRRTIQAWGSCHPTDCDWGTTPLHVLGNTVADREFPYGFATWDHGFSDVYFTLRIENDELVVESYDIFKDDSGRSNYRSIERFRREASSSTSSRDANPTAIVDGQLNPSLP